MHSDLLRVLIVDDQPLLRKGFSMILSNEADIEVVGEAANGQQAIDQVKSRRPHVVLMDISMPQMDGIAATKSITSQEKSPAILVLTTFDSQEHVFQSLQAGASGFLLKDAPPDDLIKAIRLVAAGEALLAPSVTKSLLDTFASLNQKTSVAPGIEDLTDREREVLLLMAKGLSNSELAEQLFLGETTIKTHVSSILRKVGARDRVQAVIAAYESGLVTK